jgi:hypothetical protein
MEAKKTVDTCIVCNQPKVVAVLSDDQTQAYGLCLKHFRDFVDAVIAREEAPEGRAPEFCRG